MLIRSTTLVGLAVLSMFLTGSRDAPARSEAQDNSRHAASVRVVDAAPADGAVLREPPDRVYLRFSSGIDSRHTRMALVGPTGSSSLDIQGSGGEPVRELSFPIPDQGRGQYVVRWEIEAADGERLGGRVRFVVRR